MAGEFSILSNIDAFLSGMEIENARSTKKDTKLVNSVKSISEKLDKDVRDVYDTLIPNVHILDAEYTAKLLIRDLYNHPDRYFSKVKVEEDGLVYEKNITSEYLDLAKSSARKLVTTAVAKTLQQKIIAAVDDFHKGLPTTPSKDPIADLNSLMKQPYEEIQQILADEYVSQDIKISQVTRLGSLFRANINKVFGSKVALMSATVPSLGSSNTRYVFFSKSFEGLSGKINKKISEAFISGLEASLNIGISFNVAKTAPIGSVIHLAHTALKSGADSIINTPAYAKLIFNTANAPDRSTRLPFSDPLRASNHFKLKTGHVKVAIKADKQLLDNTNILMQLGLTFTTDHSSKLNLLMSTEESRYGKGRYTSAQEAAQATRGIISQRRTASIISALVTDNPQFGTSSPNLMDMLLIKYSKILKSGKSSDQKNSVSKSKDISTKYYGPTKASKSIKLPNLKPKSSNNKLPALTKVKDAVKPSLTNLQNLINQQLQDVVSANMGDGNSRSVLNYRTGRLASSAKVEYMSESRAGMITAFYSYMKNPYATFSDGGKQSSPKSRDPKLLISKSIREIAATQVGNRLRAVNV
jgi:hypothetical protein